MDVQGGGNGFDLFLASVHVNYSSYREHEFLSLAL